MVSLCAIITGGLFAYLSIKRGFYKTWGSLFNVLVSIYLGIVLTPLVAVLAPDIGDNLYFLAGCVLVLSCVVFGTLESVLHTYVTKLFTGGFPMVFEKAGAGLLGFISGYIVCAFVLFVIGVMPFMQSAGAKKLFGNTGLVGMAQRPVKKVCNFIDSASMQAYPDSGSKVIDWLTGADKKEDEPEEYFEQDYDEVYEGYDQDEDAAYENDSDDQGV